MFRTQNLCPGSKNVFDSRQKHFYFDFRRFGMFNEVIDNKNKNFSKRNLCVFSDSKRANFSLKWICLEGQMYLVLTKKSTF